MFQAIPKDPTIACAVGREKLLRSAFYIKLDYRIAISIGEPHKLGDALNTNVHPASIYFFILPGQRPGTAADLNKHFSPSRDERKEVRIVPIVGWSVIHQSNTHKKIVSLKKNKIPRLPIAISPHKDRFIMDGMEFYFTKIQLDDHDRKK